MCLPTLSSYNRGRCMYAHASASRVVRLSVRNNRFNYGPLFIVMNLQRCVQYLDYTIPRKYCILRQLANPCLSVAGSKSVLAGSTSVLNSYSRDQKCCDKTRWFPFGIRYFRVIKFRDSDVTLPHFVL